MLVRFPFINFQERKTFVSTQNPIWTINVLLEVRARPAENVSAGKGKTEGETQGPQPKHGVVGGGGTAAWTWRLWRLWAGKSSGAPVPGWQILSCGPRRLAAASRPILVAKNGN